MIEIRNLHKVYGDKVIFSGYNCVIPGGCFMVIYGKSGAGKTTLLNMIGGLEPIDAGEIIVNGLNVSKRKEKEKYYRDIVGFLFQNFALIENKTVEQNLKLIRTKDRSDISIDEALSRVGLINMKNKKVYMLSGGEQQRLALARLMIKKCSLILADEPTGSLDEENAKIVLEILHELNKDGKTIIMVTHNKEIIQNAITSMEI